MIAATDALYVGRVVPYEAEVRGRTGDYDPVRTGSATEGEQVGRRARPVTSGDCATRDRRRSGRHCEVPPRLTLLR